jgi:hypothetical protein
MFVIGIGVLVLFSVLSVLMGNDDPRRDADPRDTLAPWTPLNAR